MHIKTPTMIEISCTYDRPRERPRAVAQQLYYSRTSRGIIGFTKDQTSGLGR